MQESPHVVLVIDDEPDVLATISDQLRSKGFVVVLPPTGWTAEDIARMPFDLLLTDIRMPVVDGIELIRRVRAARPEVPIVAYSGWLHLPEYAAERITGADQVIEKPLRAEALAEAIRRAIADRSGADADRS